MINWVFVKYLRDEDHDVSPIQKSAQALLSSTIADGDVVTDWLYYVEIQNNQDVPEWLKILQLVSCITGTLSWLSVATDGRFANLIRLAIFHIIFFSAAIVVLPLVILFEIMDCSGCAGENTLYNWINGPLFWFNNNVLTPLREGTEQKSAFSSGSLLILGILLEDIPQLVVTFIIEDKIKSDHPRGEISSAALVNLNFAIFDIFHKLAQAFDLRSDVLNPDCSVMRTIRAHKGRIESLVVAGVNHVLSTSWEKTAKLWDITSGKCINKFKCVSGVSDAVVMDKSKVITACYDKCIRIFNMTTGDLENRLPLGYRPEFVSLSPNGRSIFTGGSCIQRWDNLSSEECSFAYQWEATSLAFLQNDTFISIHRDKSIYLGNIHDAQPIQTIELQNEVLSVLTMSPIMFLVGDKVGKVHQFVFSENEWKLNSTINVSNEQIWSLTKVNKSLFVASDRTNAKLFNITNTSSPLFIFKGHGSWIRSSVFLFEQKAVATGDEFGKIKIWSIENRLGNDTQDLAQNTINNTGHDEDLTIDVAGP